MQAVRIALEDQLNELREKLALVYDFQGDRGMADFVPAGFNTNHEEETEEDEEDGIDPFDFSFFPASGKEKKMSTALVLYDPVFAAKQAVP